MPANNSEADDSKSAFIDRPAGNGRATQDSCERVIKFSQRIPEFSEIVLGCRHHLVLVSILGILVSCTLAAGAWWVTDAPFEAKSLVQVRQYQDVVFSAQTTRAEDAAFVRAQEQLALSPQVLTAALRREQLLPYMLYIPSRNAIEWLKDRLSVDIQFGSELLSVSAFHPEPEVAQALCNAVTASYMDEITSRLNSDRQLRETELERAARAADLKLDTLWEELNAVASQLGTENPQSLTIRDEIQLQAYRDYAQQLRVAQMRGNEYRQRLASEQLRQRDENLSVDEATEMLLQNLPEIVVARGRVSDINAHIQQIREIAAQDDSPRLKRLDADREFLEADLRRLMDERRPLLRIQSMEQEKVAKETSLAQLRQQIEANDAEKEFLRNRLAEIDTGSTRTDKQSGVQLEISRHAVERQTRLADGLWQSLEELRIERGSQPRVALIKLADFPDHANHGRQMKAAAACGGLGWLLVVVGIGCREWYGCRVRTVNDLLSHSHRPVLGETESHGTYKAKEASSNCSAREAAAKLMLLNSGDGHIPTLMVTSASADEPRHFVSIELSRAFAAFRRRTLLIDCDVAQPRLTSFLAAESVPGILELGTHGADPHNYIAGTNEDFIDVLVLGADRSPSTWLEPKVLREVLETLRGDYEAIVVNGPPILSSAESLLLAAQADQTLLAVFTGKSRWNRVAASEKNAIECGITVAGSILHSAKMPAPMKLNQRQQYSAQSNLAADVSLDQATDADETNLHQGITAIQEDLQNAVSGMEPQRSIPQSVRGVSR